MNINTARFLFIVVFPMAAFTCILGWDNGMRSALEGFFLGILPLYNAVYLLAILSNFFKNIDVSGHWILCKSIWIFYLISLMLWLFFFTADDETRAFDFFVKPAYLDPSPITDPDWHHSVSELWEGVDTGHQRIMLKESTTYHSNDSRPHLNWKDLSEEQKQTALHWCREQNGNYPDWAKNF